MWSLVVENLLRGVSELLSGLAYVTDMLPGTATGSVAGALGQASAAGGGAPVVQTILDGTTAALVVAVHTVGCAVLAAVLMRRRDLA